jgi:hypothetical protein
MLCPPDNRGFILHGNAIVTEIIHRLQDATPFVRQSLLGYLLPWLYNMELVDQTLPPACSFDRVPPLGKDSTLESIKPPLKGRGWGSPEATNMILNNLFYITLTVSVIVKRKETESSVCFAGSQLVMRISLS